MEENTKSVAESIDVESMGVEDKYDGPKLIDNKVDLQFMKVTEGFIHFQNILFFPIIISPYRIVMID